MEGVFYKPVTEYKNKLNPVKSYIEQLTNFIQVRQQCTKEEANEKARKVLKTYFKDKSVKYFQKVDNGDKVVENSSLLRYIMDNIQANNILVPTFTSYVNGSVKESILSKFIGINVKNRAVAKKESMAAKARGDMAVSESKNNEQNNMKIRNNSVSGLFGQRGSILYSPTAHSTLTSVTRTVTSLANACNERNIAGNRYLPRQEDVYRTIVYESTYANVEDIKRICEKYNIYLPTTEDVVKVLKRCSDLYFMDNRYYDKHIVPFLDNLTPYHRAAICYVGDLYTLRTFNEGLIRGIMSELIKRTENTGTKLDDPNVLYKVDEPILYFAHTIHSYEIQGMGKDYGVMNEKGLAKCIHDTSENIKNTLLKYKDFFNTFFMTDMVPINSHRLRNMRRRTVALSDTDSSAFTLDDWAAWWEGGEAKVNPATVGVAGAVTYIVASVIINQLSLLSKSLNIEEHKLRVLAMKNEYLWSSFIPADVSKHYYAYTTICEGNVFAKPDVEIKGVHLKNSAVPTQVIARGEAIMEDIMKKIHVNDKLNLTSIVDEMIGIENEIIESITRGEAIFLKKSKIKEASAYAQGPDKSPYQRHLLWVDVFEPKYGEIEEPVYDVVKLPTTIVNKTTMREWLESIEDVPLRGRLTKWLEDYKKNSLPTIYLNETYVQGSGIPEEIASVINIKQIVFDMTLQLRIILETLGLILNSELMISEQFDTSSGLLSPKVGFNWSRVGDGYEVSTKGDKRFSAFNAILPNGKSIEYMYQVGVKGYSSIEEGKGKPPLKEGVDTWDMYLKLWKLWAKHNPELIQELKVLASKKNYLLTDMFGHTEINQARALSIILNEN